MEMGSESIQGSSEDLSAACGGGLVGHAFLTLCGGEGRYAVAPEDILQCLAGLVPNLARGAEGGVGYVADPACRAAGGTDLAVEALRRFARGTSQGCVGGAPARPPRAGNLARRAPTPSAHVPRTCSSE